MQRLAWIACAAALGLASPALADPCEAPVTGYAPGAKVAGKIRYVVDGDGICVGAGSDPRTWTEIRLADFYAPETSTPAGQAAAAAMSRMVMGKTAECIAQRSDRGPQTFTYDRLIAVCRIDGTSVGEMMKRAGIGQGGRGR